MPPSASATPNRANFPPFIGPGIAPVIARHLGAWINLFVTALHETRRRQADRVIQEHRHLIDNFKD